MRSPVFLIFATLLPAMAAVRPAAATAAPVVVASVIATQTDGGGTARLQRLAIQAPDAATDGARVTIRSGQVRQRWMGAGAALTDSSASLLAGLPAAQRADILRRLFDRDGGAGLNLVRLTIGASDFSPGGNYSYSTAPGQLDFSRNRQAIIPVLQEIRRLQPALQLMAAPWSPPAWMKKNHSMNGGAVNADFFPDYARYLSGYARFFLDQDLPLTGLSIQNEPLNSRNDYPTATLSAADSARFVHDYLRPALDAAGARRVGIYGLDHNWSDWGYAQELAQSSAGADYVGYAFHCYRGRPEDVDRLAPYLQPGQTLIMSECSPLLTSGFAQSFHYTMTQLVDGSLKHGGSAILLWNLALDDQGGPFSGGCNTCKGVVTLDRQPTGAAAPYPRNYDASYFALAQLTLAARPGDQVVLADSSDPALLATAFRHPDGRHALLVYNRGGKPVSFRSQLDHTDFSYQLPPNAAVTFTQEN